MTAAVPPDGSGAPVASAAAEPQPPVLLEQRDLVNGGTAGQVLHLTLNRPEVRNAMSLDLVSALRRALAEAEAAGDVRAIVLRGAGGHFCAGADLKDLALARNGPVRPEAGAGSGVASQANAATDATGAAAAIEALNARFGELCVAFASTGIAVVAVVEGTVMGGGFGLACVADVVLAGTSVIFKLPETSLGVVPAQIAPFLVDRLGASEARRLVVTGARIDAEEALALRLVHEVHAAGALDHAIAHTLAAILRCAPQAVAASKRLLARARWQAAADLVPDAARVFAAATMSAEGWEGTTAFLQKRLPAWAPQ